MEAGIPGLSVLAGATGVAASALHSEDFGTLEVGRRGDVVLVGPNPWTDPTALSNVKIVVQNGVVVYNSSTGAPEPD